MATEAEKEAARQRALKSIPIADRPRFNQLEKDYEQRAADGEPVGDDRTQYALDRLHGTR